MADLDGYFFERRGEFLVPGDFHAEDLMKTLTEGKGVLLTVKKPRSPQNHSHFFAILHTAWTHLQDEYADEEVLLDAVKLACRHIRMVEQLDGKVLALPKSISFSAMSEDKFRQFKDRAMYVLAGRLGVTVEELVNEVEPLRARNRR